MIRCQAAVENVLSSSPPENKGVAQSLSRLHRPKPDKPGLGFSGAVAVLG